MSTIHADKSLALLEQTTGLTEHGKAWLTAAIDPFHDESIPNLAGFPDGSCARSVVQIVRSSMTIRKPAAVTGTGWDLHIISYPHLNITEYVQGQAVSRWSAGSTSVQPGDIPFFGTKNNPTVGQYVTWGGITAYANEVGGNASNPFNRGTATQDQSLVNSLSMDNNYLIGNVRCIAKGYEILSVGPELTKAGTAYVWQEPVANTPDVTLTTMGQIVPATGVTANNVFPVVTYDACPGSLDAAILIPDTKTWPAKKGAYVVDRLNTDKVFSANSQDTGVLYRCRFNTADPSSAITSAVASKFGSAAMQFAGVTGQTTFPAIQTSVTTNFNHSGVYLSGLSNEDVIVVTGVWYIERIPTEQQLDLVVLAQPSPLKDTVALDIYSKMASFMPVGMYQDANSFGDWFKDAVSVVSDTVAPALSMMPGPLGMVGKAVTAGGGLLNKILEKTKDSPSPTSTIQLNEVKKDTRPLRQASGRVKKEEKVVKKAVKKVRKMEKAVKKATKKKKK